MVLIKRYSRDDDKTKKKSKHNFFLLYRAIKKENKHR